MSGTTLVETTTSPERPGSGSPSGAAARTGILPPAEKPAASGIRLRLRALAGRLLMVLGALAVVTAYALLPLAAALRAGALLGGAALVLAAVVVVEAALAVTFVVLKTEARH